MSDEMKKFQDEIKILKEKNNSLSQKLGDEIKTLKKENNSLSEQLEDIIHEVKLLKSKGTVLTAEQKAILARVQTAKRQKDFDSKVIKVRDIKTPAELAMKRN